MDLFALGFLFYELVGGLNSNGLKVGELIGDEFEVEDITDGNYSGA